jgi:hypothetical protein
MNRRTQRDLRAIDYKIARELLRQDLVDVPFIPSQVSALDVFTDELWWMMSANRRGKEVTSCEGSFPRAVCLLALGTLR